MTEQEIFDLNGKMRLFDEEARERALARWNSLAKPLGSLGTLESAICDVAGIRGDENITFKRSVLYIICADNGVVAEGVSQCGYEATTAVAKALAVGKSTVNHLAEGMDIDIVPVDAGIKDFSDTQGIRDLRIRNGTGNIAVESAMTVPEAVRSIENGIMLTEKAADEGYEIVLTGEMGIGNTTTSSALCSVLLDMDPREVTGRGAGLSTAGLEKKIGTVRRAKERYFSLHNSNNESYIELLAELGGLDIAVLTGICIGGGLYGIPVLVDGFITLTAALLACKITPGCKRALIGSHVSSEPAAKKIITELGLKPFVDAEMRLGEGSGAVAALRLLKMAVVLYNSGHTFNEIGIEAYKCLD